MRLHPHCASVCHFLLIPKYLVSKDIFLIVILHNVLISLVNVPWFWLCKYCFLVLSLWSSESQKGLWILSSGKWIHLAHPPGPTQKLIFTQTISYIFPPKKFFFQQKSFCTCFKELITWPCPKNFLFLPKENNFFMLEEQISYTISKKTLWLSEKNWISQTKIVSSNYQKA